MFRVVVLAFAIAIIAVVQRIIDKTTERRRSLFGHSPAMIKRYSRVFAFTLSGAALVVLAVNIS